MTRLCPICSSDHKRVDCKGLALIRDVSHDGTLYERTVVMRWAPGEDLPGFVKKAPDGKPLKDADGKIRLLTFPTSTKAEAYYWVPLARIEVGSPFYESIGKAS